MISSATEESDCALGLAWLGLSCAAAVLGRAKEVGAKAVWRASVPTLRSWGITARSIDLLVEARRLFDASEARRMLKMTGQRFIPLGAPAYPRELLGLEAPPAGLFVAGEPHVLERLLRMPRLTVVGTRRASAEGGASARAFSEALAARGIAVVSGLALGIDGQAHSAALKSGGLTVAVLGSGVDVVYPPRHRWLYSKIRDEGVVLSELPPGSRPTKWSFPRRNRLLAALGDAVLVVEGSNTSGALQTAGWALKLGRQVFAVPGSIWRESNEGGNSLIYDGASPALKPEDLVEDFLKVTRMERGGRESLCPARAVGEQLQLPGVAVENTLGLRVVEALKNGPLSVDDLTVATGLSVREVNAALGELEVRGKVSRAGPGLFMYAPRR